jgi:hypothetical protein
MQHIGNMGLERHWDDETSAGAEFSEIKKGGLLLFRDKPVFLDP